ncbi:MAG: cytochrome b N-terminal domain-containing protein [Longimicrobiales bacterium]
MSSIKKTLRYVVTRLDAALNRVYGWRFNPLYQSGSLVVLALVIMLITGLYLLLFYRIGSPADSVARVTAQPWTGRWIRSLHRYAADLAVVAAAVHAVRMFFQGRTWGPRALAWVSGLFLLFLIYVCGWTGYVMVWDLQAQLLAMEGARLLDALPIFSQPITRAFVGEAPPPSPFFFLNLFLHIAIPIGMAGALWLHVSRVARPVLLPPRPLLWGVTGILFFWSVAWPVPMYEIADLLSLPGDTTVDVFYSFWLPFSRALPPGLLWGALISAGALLTAIPFFTRPAPDNRPQPSYVEPRFCTGCEQCYVDCPYDAISMVARDDDRGYELGLVDPALCVSCGICAGSCAPMGVGPPLRTGRDQLEDVTQFIERQAPSGSDVVLVACSRSAGGSGSEARGTPIYPVTCVGNLHTSVVEYLVRSGAGGVLIAACPPRDCWSREGPTWLDERLYHDREAELKARVDRRRIRVVYAAEAESGLLSRELQSFRAEVNQLGTASADADIDLELICLPSETEGAR